MGAGVSDCSGAELDDCSPPSSASWIPSGVCPRGIELDTNLSRESPINTNNKDKSHPRISHFIAGMRAAVSW